MNVKREKGRRIGKSLTKRRCQVLASIYRRIKMFGKCQVYDLLGDLGIAHGTLFDHLQGLKNAGLVSFSKEFARNLNVNDRIELTSRGEELVKFLIKNYDLDITQPISTIHEKIENIWAQKLNDLRSDLKRLNMEVYHEIKNSSVSKLSKVIHELFERNVTEPITTSLAMYSDIDQCLHEWKKSEDKSLFERICRGWLNLEIRVGRITGMVIPVALRGRMEQSYLKRLLESTWAWPKIVRSTTFKRYIDEARSLGLLNLVKRELVSTKLTESYVLEWLASRVYRNYENIITSNPNVSLLIYRESFKFPREEDIMYPEHSDIELEWLNIARDTLKQDYEDIVGKALKILKDKTGLLIEFKDRLIPYGYSKIMENIEDIRERLRILLRSADEGYLHPKILLLVHANPGITIGEIKKKMQIDDLKKAIELIEDLQKAGFIITGSYNEEYTRVYSFLHIPYVRISEKRFEEANAIIRTYIVQVLSDFNKSLRSDINLYDAFIKVLEKLLNYEILSYDDLESEFGGKIGTRIFLTISSTLSPLINVDERDLVLKINRRFESVSKIILDILRYELLTGSEALSVYSSTITDVVMKSLNEQKLREELDTLKELITKDLGITD